MNSNGFAVNGLASTPYDLAVGGTDFDPTTESQYWTSANQAGTLASATTHIPEIVWNDSCANPVLAAAFQIPDPIQFCNTAKLPGQTTANPFIEISGGGGGLSSCTITDSQGNCTGGYAQPGWQTGYSVGTLGARALPDVSMIATRWLVCSYDTNPCDPTRPPTFPPAATGTIKVVGGTSAAAPAVAAILAMLDQSQITPTAQDGRQGLVNPLLYGLATAEFQNSGVAGGQCSASQGPVGSSLCVFYDVTNGSNSQPCSVSNYASKAAGSLPASTCATESGDATGIMEVNGVQSYVASAGFDIASGLGSLNASGLIAAVQASNAPTGLAASASGQTVTLTWTADASATQGYDVYQAPAPGPVSSTPVQRNVVATTATITGLQLGASYVFAVAAVSATGVSPASPPAQATLVPPAPTGLRATVAGPGSLLLTWAASTGASAYDVYEGTSPGGEGTSPAAIVNGSLSLPLAGLTAGQPYYFTVSAVDAGGTSVPSAQASATVVPAAPTGLAATPGNGTVSLTWSAAAGAASYDVYEGNPSNAQKATPIQTGLTGPSASVGGLSNGTIYYFFVAAVDAGGVSGPSNQASATPTAPAGGGGGSMGWLEIAALGALAAARKGAIRLRRSR